MHRRVADLERNFMLQTGSTLWESETNFMIFVLHTFLQGTYVRAQFYS